MTRLFVRFTGHQLLLIARDRQLLFWNFWFFLILLLVFLGLLSGDDAAVQVTLASGIVTVGIMANALFSVAVGLTAARERGVFRRYWLTPVVPALPVASAVCARGCLVFGAAAVQIVVARAAFGVPWSGGIASWIAVAALGTIAFAAIGFAIASAASSPHVANTVANLVFIPMMALGGASLPSNMMPAAWAEVYWVLPVAGISDGLFGAFARGETVLDNAWRLLYLAGWAIAASAWALHRWIRRGP